MKLDLLESLFNIAANHAIGCELWQGFICILIKGNIMPINGTICKTINCSKYKVQKIMNQVWMRSLWNVVSNHYYGFGILKHFECIFGNGKGICHIDVFCIFAKIAIVTMSKSCRIYSWNFLDKYGSTRRICFTISFEFVSREREWSI